jgi:hypothetical protein
MRESECQSDVNFVIESRHIMKPNRGEFLVTMASAGAWAPPLLAAASSDAVWSGYDKGDSPREGYDPTEAIVPYIDRAGKDSAQLVVFPEYVLGHVRVPSPITKKILVAAAANHIYVIIGGWETYADGSFADTALIFDRPGMINGKYLKTQAAVDYYEGNPPWSFTISQEDPNPV